MLLTGGKTGSRHCRDMGQTRRTDLERVMAVERDALAHERIQVRRVRLPRALPIVLRLVARPMPAHICPSEVVGDNHDDIRLLRRCDRRRRDERRERCQADCHDGRRVAQTAQVSRERGRASLSQTSELMALFR